MARLTPVRTDDGSLTFHNDEVDECYHTTSGALEEALEKHLIPSGLLNKSKDIVVGDLFFGLGYNSIVAMQQFFEKHENGFMQIFAFENDIGILSKIKDLELPNIYKPFQEKIVKLLDSLEKKTNDYSLYVYADDNIFISLYLGDIRDTLLLLSNEVLDIVFFDPFSPKKHPVFWEVPLLEEVFRIMNKDSALTTYSCARKVRDNLKAVGFEVMDGPCVGRKSPSTVALKKVS